MLPSDKLSPLTKIVEFVDLRAQQREIKAELSAAIDRVLEHGQYIMGPEVSQLEKELGMRAGVRNVICCGSGTDALLIALMAQGIGPGDAVLCPAFTYTATPESVALLGATPVFVDVERDTFNIDPTKVSAAIELASRRGLRAKALIAVDLFGLPAAYERLSSVAADNRLWILGDAAQSFGASTVNGAVGSLALITATSFFPSKPLGCYGDGGAIFTNDDDLASIMRSIAFHGRGSEKYDVIRVGVNSRLDSIQAAILLCKLKLFDAEIVLRNSVANRYNKLLNEMTECPVVPPGYKSAWAQYTLKVPRESRSAIVTKLYSKGVPTQIYYPRPLHHQPAFSGAVFDADTLMISESLSQEVLSLPIHPYLSVDQQQFVAERVGAALLFPDRDLER